MNGVVFRPLNSTLWNQMMVRLVGPGLARGASGTLGGSLVFSSSKGRAYLKKHASPKQPRTVEQKSMRAMMKFLSSQWSQIPPPDQATWQNAPQRDTISPINAYQAYNLQRWRNQLGPSQTYPAPGDGSSFGIDGVDATGGVRCIRFQFQTHSAIDSWGMLIYDESANPPSPVWKDLIHVEPVPNPDVYDFTLGGMRTGLHSIVFNPVLTTGRFLPGTWYRYPTVTD